MQLQTDKSHRLDEIKTQFRAREGYYRLMNSPDYSQRSQKAMGFSTGTANSNSSTATNEKTCIKISLVTIYETNQSNNRQQLPMKQRCSTHPLSNLAHSKDRRICDTKICFNVGRELFVYNYDGVRTGPDASNPIYKRSYKNSSPTCHDFNQITATSRSLSLLVGFSHGQVQLIDLNGSEDQEACKEFNVDRLNDKTRVTCVKWLPNSANFFLVAHASGNLYLYKDDLPCGPSAPTYQLYKQSEGIAIYTCKTKATRNPIYRWVIGNHHPDNGANLRGSSQSLSSNDHENYSLNEFAFSPCAKYLACVSQDGFLRVYCYDTMELVGRARSYYGGLTCVCWSPDGKYVVTGGEDDLVTVWSFIDRRVVARGLGHKSWISVVAFDTFYDGCDLKDTDVYNDDDDDDEDNHVVGVDHNDRHDNDSFVENKEVRFRKHREDSYQHDTKNADQCSDSNTCINSSSRDYESSPMTSYRFGSVGQDTQLCLWDLNDDLLRQPIVRSRASMMGTNSNNLVSMSGIIDENFSRESLDLQEDQQATKNNSRTESHDVTVCRETKPTKPNNATGGGFLSNKGSGFTKTFSLVGKRDKRNLSQRNSDKQSTMKGNTSSFNNSPTKLTQDPTKLLGSPICPRMSEVPLLEPSVCKKVSFERLTSLIFCQDGFITSCQDGYVFSWARPTRRSMKISPGQSNEELRVIDVGTSSMV